MVKCDGLTQILSLNIYFSHAAVDAGNYEREEDLDESRSVRQGVCGVQDNSSVVSQRLTGALVGNATILNVCVRDKRAFNTAEGMIHCETHPLTMLKHHS